MSEIKPEAKAREIIDKKLNDAGWDVVNRDEYCEGMQAVAVREALLRGNKEADYLLFIEGKAIGVVEAKREETNLDEVVAAQAEDYTRRVPNWCQAWLNPLPIVYLANGREIKFKNCHKSDSEYETISEFHSPYALLRMFALRGIGALYYGGLPTLRRHYGTKSLRECQYQTILSVENAFRSGKQRALIEMATGAGKTFTACMLAYRMLQYTPTHRILYLVDRTNLGIQALGEFANFKLTEDGSNFNTQFEVTQLKKSTIEGRPDVCISTIQRLFSILNGKEMSEDEENQLSDDLVDNDNIIPFDFSSNDAKLPRDYFDFIFVDECHRSIYGSWRKVLEYFDSARIVGLTATPGLDTYAFFNNTIAYRYSLEQSVVDGVNVGYRVFRIKTDATENGGTFDPKKAKRIRKRDNQTDKTPISSSTYTKTDLNQTVVNPTQIRTIIKSFKDSIYTKLYPDRIDNYNFIPKTLIFAQNERHAKNIVDAVNEVFEHQAGDGFVQQITYSSGNSNDLVKRFNNDAYFRIAVTVTLVATGTDVKPLEIVMFMRDIHSIQLYQQMRGRGCRSIDDDILRTVTPNATTKDVFYLIDAVGVTESEKEFAAITGKSDATPTLEKLLEQITHGYLTDDHLMLLANKLARIHKKAEEPQREKFCQLAGVSLQILSARLMDALSPVATPNTISMCCALPEFVDVNAPNTERKQLVAPLTRSKQARDYLLLLNAGFLTILNPGEDTLISANFNVEEAMAATTDFRKYLDENRDSFEALRIIYQRHVGVLTYEMLTELRDALIHHDARFNPGLLWEHYVTLDPQKAKKLTVAKQRDLLTNLIQLVRYAWQQTDTLESLAATGSQYFNLWCGHNSGIFKRAFTDEQKALLSEISEYILANGYLTIRDIREICDDSTASQIANIFGNAKEANQELKSLANFLIFHKAA